MSRCMIVGAVLTPPMLPYTTDIRDARNRRAPARATDRMHPRTGR